MACLPTGRSWNQLPFCWCNREYASDERVGFSDNLPCVRLGSGSECPSISINQRIGRVAALVALSHQSCSLHSSFSPSPFHPCSSIEEVLVWKCRLFSGIDNSKDCSHFE